MMILLTCAVVLAFASLTINAITWVRLHKSIHRQSTASAMLAGWHQLFGTLFDVELGARGFLVSGDERFMQVYSQARENYSRLSMGITSEEDMEPWLRQAWTQVGADIDALLAASHEVVVLRNHSTQETAQEFFNLGKSWAALQTIRQEMELIIQGQERAIEQRDAL